MLGTHVPDASLLLCPPLNVLGALLLLGLPLTMYQVNPSYWALQWVSALLTTTRMCLAKSLELPIRKSEKAVCGREAVIIS